MQNEFAQLSELVVEYLPGVLIALVILIVGWLVALVLAAAARGTVRPARPGLPRLF